MFETNEGAKEIIVTRSFNHDDVIGVLKLIPGVQVPINSVFTLGGVVKKSHTLPNVTEVVDEFDLLEVSLIKDTDYKPYTSR